MKAGSLDRVVTVQRAVESTDDLGQVLNTWSTIATLRAAKIQATTAEYLREAGLQGDGVVIFRTRWLDGLTVRDRLLCEGAAYDVKEIKELGRRKGLEIRTVARAIQ